MIMRTNEVMGRADAVIKKVHSCRSVEWVRYVAYKRLKPKSDCLTVFAETTTHGEKTLAAALWCRKRYNARRMPWGLGGLPQEIYAG